MSNGKPQVAVVTGAGNGIGRALAVALGNEGWNVVGVDVDEAALIGLAGTNREFRFIVGDVRDGETLTAARQAAEAAGNLSAWVNNAGIVRLGPLHSIERDLIDALLDIDLRAVVFGAREALQSFIAHSVAGSIINISSIHARGAFPSYGPYDAAKAGVEALTRYICVEYGHLGIRCNAVAPGAVRTSIAASGNDGSATSRWPPAAALAPMGRVSEPEEIASAVVFLLSDGAFAINGHTLAVDNGMSSRSYAFEIDPEVRFATPSE